MVQSICRVMDGRLVILLDPGASAANDYLRQDKSKEKRFAFDQAFGDVDTKTLFTATAEPLIKSVLQGYNATVFAYGSTGAGKTFTMIGTPVEPGIMFRSVEEIFRGVEANAEEGKDCFSVSCSFVEVYNENFRDLACETSSGILDLREDPVCGSYVAGITEVQAQSVQEVMDLLQHGNQRRTTEPTAMNVTSSRSHAVLQVRVERRASNPSSVSGTLMGKLSMIDLAGSERAAETKNSGLRLLEGAKINRSLLALGNCINALASGSSFVPYRDSKLTRLLKDSLGGNCKTVMIANASPSHLSYEDTLNTLKYANRAKNIRVRAKQNLVTPGEHVSQYEHAIADLRNEVSILKAKLAQRSAVPDILAGGDENELKEASENWKLDLIRNLESRTSLQRSLIDVERGLVQWRVELDQAKEMIVHWDERMVTSPGRRRPDARSLDDWKEAMSQIEENIKENIETRRSLAERLQQNKTGGRELQKQLSQRVLNEDLRAFLELIQRVQVLEVERLELDHFWEIHRQQLEQRDQEIAMLREQLRLRNGHIQQQRQELDEKVPGHVFLLGSTLAESSPVQQRGPLRVMQAWAPAREDDEERVASLSEEAEDFLQDKINWRALEVPMASQIKGLAQLQQNAGTSRLIAAKAVSRAWKDPAMRSIPEARAPRRPLALAQGGVAPPPVAPPRPPQPREPGNSSPSQTRGSTCPPLRRKSSLEAQVTALAPRQPSIGDMRSPPRGLLRAHGVAVPQRQLDKNLGVRDKSRLRARSEHSRLGRVGRALVTPTGVPR
ncbi:Kinesin-like protein KIF19 [Durusdinium trenchii]|uniref:Kinesin-like protein n=1 Tax=Durusdinium trenchii TaxID=1381693 RepID=A0ABP0INL0_9DINO